MSITREKKTFIKAVSGGLSTLMDSSCTSEEIYLSPDNYIERFIHDNVLDGSSFSPDLFCRMIDDTKDETLIELQHYFDSIDMNLQRSYFESCIPHGEFSDFAELIEGCEIETFEDFITFDTSGCTTTGSHQSIQIWDGSGHPRLNEGLGYPSSY